MEIYFSVNSPPSQYKYNHFVLYMMPHMEYFLLINIVHCYLNYLYYNYEYYYFLLFFPVEIIFVSNNLLHYQSFENLEWECLFSLENMKYNNLFYLYHFLFDFHLYLHQHYYIFLNYYQYYLNNHLFFDILAFVVLFLYYLHCYY